MAEQTATATDRRPKRAAPGTVPRWRADRDTETLSDADELLDAIDDVLESNELEIVTRYRQRGGE